MFFSELENISPVCFYGFSTYEQKMYSPRNALAMLNIVFKKWDLGIILMENLKLKEKPMKMLDKAKIMTTNQVKVSCHFSETFQGVDDVNLSCYEVSQDKWQFHSHFQIP